jgi:hypothetical protein
MSKKTEFTTLSAIERLMSSMEEAINNMIDEVKRPVDQEVVGSARKAELQSVKQTAVDCQELIRKYQELSQMYKELNETGGVSDKRDFGAGFAEKNAK